MKVADIEQEHASDRLHGWGLGSDEILRKHSWQEISESGKFAIVLIATLRIAAILLILFLYICSLAQIATAFSLIGSFGLGEYIQHSPLLYDPISALILGMVTTVVLQSPNATTTVLVSMVAANMITVHMAIPVMIGSEMGSSLVNSFVSMAYSGNKEQFRILVAIYSIVFRRAFAAATLGDIFNLCSLSIILPLELMTSFIEKTSWLIVDPLVTEKGLTFKTLDLLTDPFNKLILQVNEEEIRRATVSPASFPPNHTFVMRCVFNNGSRIPNCPYDHFFSHSTLSDMQIGTVVLIFSVLALILSLCGIVYLTTKLLSGHVAAYIHNFLEKEFPRPFSFLTGYFVMLVGLVVTVLVQSNSIFSSSLTPLVGLGVISLEKVYPLTLGSNIGTTFSGVLAAMSADETRFEKTLHMAMCQVLYNVFGTLLFYIIPITRWIPVFLASRLGNASAEHRWFIFVYIIGMFIILPAVIFALSLGPDCLIIVFVLIATVFIATIVLINFLQIKCPTILPTVIRTWEYFPRPLRSFKYWDDVFLNCCGAMPLVGRFVRQPSDAIESEAASSAQHSPFEKLSRLAHFTSV